MAELRMNRYDRAFTVELSDRDDYARAERILAAAVLQINDRVAGLYAGMVSSGKPSLRKLGGSRG